MSLAGHDPAAPRRATNLSVNTDLLARARALGINLSQVLEAALAEKVREEEARRWREATREAIEAYNRRVEAEGVFSDGQRSF